MAECKMLATSGDIGTAIIIALCFGFIIVPLICVSLSAKRREEMMKDNSIKKSEYSPSTLRDQLVPIIILAIILAICAIGVIFMETNPGD